MRFQCDVCSKNEASVFCPADEACLCVDCDRRVHRANKLAGNHRRFALQQQSPKRAPICDICKERRAFFFCPADRAILCRDCDVYIHQANTHTQMHTRFLLTGVRVSEVSSASSADEKNVKSLKSQVIVSQTNVKASKSAITRPPTTQANSCGVSGSFTSEYSVGMLPFEDYFPNSPFSASYGFSEEGNNGLELPMMGADFQNVCSTIPGKEMGFWDPQVVPSPLNLTQNRPYEAPDLTSGATAGTKQQLSMEFNADDTNTSSSKWFPDSSFLTFECYHQTQNFSVVPNRETLEFRSCLSSLLFNND